MRFPLSLTTNMVGYMARKKLTGQKRYPLVLMLEPLHACNLTCTGCGRIREYSQTIKDKLTIAECLQAVEMDVEKEPAGGSELVEAFLNEHAVGAEVNILAAFENAAHQGTDLRIDQRLAAADTDDGRTRLIDGLEALCYG